MCGIAGVLSREADRQPPAAWGPIMSDAIRHRGPDGQGLAAEGPILLAHTRLSIIDLEHGQQPMSTEDGGVTLIFNGEIYNHPEERARLEGSGHRFRTRSDTEVILELYRAHGLDFVERLRGMFALALWDRDLRRLVLARDRFGIKPLYLCRGDGWLAFASEVKALLSLPFVERRADPLALKEYLFLQHSLGPRSFFAGVERLEPATLAWFDADGKDGRRTYWRLRYASGPNGSPPVDVESALCEAVESHLLSDVPVGALLSGGLDTSAIVSIAGPRYPGPLHTYTAGVPGEGPGGDLACAETVSRRYGTVQHRVMMSPARFAASFPHVMWHLEEPGGGVPALAAFHLARRARQKVRVILSGEGSDEVFAGYSHYLRAHVESAIRGGRAWGALGMIARLGSRLGSRRDALSSLRWILRGGRPPLEYRRPHFRGASAAFLGPRLREEAKGHDPIAQADAMILAADTGADPLNALQWLDLRTYLLTILHIYDRMCMAASVEARVPFLDHPLVELVAAIPPGGRLQDLQPKAALRTVLQRRLPPEILSRPKRGFFLPVSTWFRGSLRGWVRDLLTDGRLAARGLVDAPRVESLLQAHERGEDWGKEIWTLLNLEMWSRTFIDRAPQPGPCPCLRGPRA